MCIYVCVCFNHGAILTDYIWPHTGLYITTIISFFMRVFQRVEDSYLNMLIMDHITLLFHGVT